MKKVVCILFSILMLLSLCSCSSDDKDFGSVTITSCAEYECSKCGTVYWGNRQKISCVFEYHGKDLTATKLSVYIKRDPESRPSTDPAYGTEIHDGWLFWHSLPNYTTLSDGDTYDFEICAPAFLNQVTVVVRIVQDDEKEKTMEKELTIEKGDN